MPLERAFILDSYRLRFRFWAYLERDAENLFSKHQKSKLGTDRSKSHKHQPLLFWFYGKSVSRPEFLEDFILFIYFLFCRPRPRSTVLGRWGWGKRRPNGHRHTWAPVAATFANSRRRRRFWQGRMKKVRMQKSRGTDRFMVVDISSGYIGFQPGDR